MARTLLSVLGGCLAFLLAGGGILLLGWLLYWLWSRQQQEETETIAEIELDARTVDAEPGAVPGMEEEALPPPEKEEPLPEPEEDLVPEAGEPEPGAVRAAILAADIGSPRPPDDLRVIEGIGPRIAGVLNAAGIGTFHDLAATDAERIEAILAAEDPRLARLATPDTWPEQAALAAAGDWEALAELTDTLKGGRRV